VSSPRPGWRGREGGREGERGVRRRNVEIRREGGKEGGKASERTFTLNPVVRVETE
jgi:hypothetical protein